jgi:hypothetical protein
MERNFSFYPMLGHQMWKTRAVRGRKTLRRPKNVDSRENSPLSPK